jgi:hypothetical protein
MKKFLLLFLISLPAFAQFKVEVKDLSGFLTHGGEFSTEAEAQSWVQAQELPIAKDLSAWGKLERLVDLKDASDEDRAQAIEVVPANQETGEPSKLRLRKSYTVTITDVTAERQAENSARALKQQRIQDALNDLDSISDSDVDAFSVPAPVKAFLKRQIKILKAFKDR